MIDALQLNLRYALRTIAKTPVFSGLLLLILALGIGANTAMFSIVDAFLFRPLPAKNPEQLVRLFPADEAGRLTYSFAYPVLNDYRDQSRSFEQIAAYSEWNELNISIQGKKAELVSGAIVSGNFFGTMNVRPYLGRLIFPSDDQTQGKHPVVVISNRFWKKFFDSRRDAIGKTIRVNGTVFTVIGVTDSTFTGAGLDHIPEFWIPMAMVDVFLPEFSDIKPLKMRGFGWLDAIGRLKPGISLEQAQAELRVIGSNLAANQSKGKKDPSVKLIPAEDAMIDVNGSDGVAKISWLLLGVTLLVLLIAAVVASGLLLVRAEQRQKEVAVRLAMGASRGQIIGQMILESFLMAMMAAVGGFVFALWCTDLLANVIGNEGFTLPLNAATPLLTARVFIATVVLSSITALLFGAFPAVLSSRASLLPALKNETVHAGRIRILSLKNIFIVTQVAFSILLLTGAGLLLRTLWKTRAVEPGFDTRRAVVATMDVAKQGYNEDAGRNFYRKVLDSLRSTAGMESVALAKTVPVQNSGMRLTFDDTKLETDLNIVSPGFFKTLGIPILRGRDFRDTDTQSSPRVAIVNEAMAKRLWPNTNPVGQILKDVGPVGDQPVEIVGVVRDVKFRSLQQPVDPMLYAPHSQWYMASMTIVATGKMTPEATLLQLQRTMEGLDKSLPLFSTKTLQQKLEQSLLRERVLAGLLMVFASLALLLAAVGLYSLLSFIAQTRTREIGVRMAIGARRSDVLKSFLARGLALTAAGIAAGLFLSLLGSRALETLLFAVTRFDVTTYASITLLMITTAFAASYFPARRAAKLDPVKALRYE